MRGREEYSGSSQSRLVDTLAVERVEKLFVFFRPIYPGLTFYLNICQPRLRTISILELDCKFRISTHGLCNK